MLLWRSGNQLLDGGQRHLDLPQGANQAGGGQLIRLVVAVARFGVYVGGTQDVAFLVEPQCLARQPRGFGEVAN